MLSKTALKSSTTYLLRLLRRKLAKSFAAASNPVVDLSKNAEIKSVGMVFDLLLWWKQTQKKQTKKEKIRRIGTMHNGGDTNTHSKYTWCRCTGAPWRRPILNASCCTWCASMTSLEFHRISEAMGIPSNSQTSVGELWWKKAEIHSTLRTGSIWGKTLTNNIGIVTLCETHYINRSSNVQLRLQPS